MKHIFLLSLLSFFSLTVFAQDPCDDVSLLSVKYNAFTDTVIIVHLENNSVAGFQYPGFVMINETGDTVAREQVDLFGIGQESVHQLQVRGGVQNPLENFVGDIELHTGYYDVLACSWDLDQSLCLDGSCDSLIIGFENYGGALVMGDFTWSVQDDMGYVAESGQFTMVAEVQSWRYGLCLAPGNYTYTLDALTAPSGGGPTLTASTSRNYFGPTLTKPLDWFNDPGTELEVPFFTFCTESPSGIGEEGLNDSAVSLLFDRASKSLNSSEVMQEVKVYSVLGELVYQSNPLSKTFNISELTTGTYIAVATTSEGEVRAKFVLN